MLYGSAVQAKTTEIDRNIKKDIYELGDHRETLGSY